MEKTKDIGKILQALQWKSIILKTITFPEQQVQCTVVHALYLLSVFSIGDLCYWNIRSHFIFHSSQFYNRQAQYKCIDHSYLPSFTLYDIHNMLCIQIFNLLLFHKSLSYAFVFPLRWEIKQNLYTVAYN